MIHPALILAFLLSGDFAAGEPSTPASTLRGEALRTWTNATGTLQTDAVLLRIEGEKLSLQRPDGQVASTTFAALSRADQEYVEECSLKHTAHHWTASAVGLRHLQKGLTTLSAALQVPADDPCEPRRVVPAALVYMRVSREFLEDFVERSIDRRKPVRDCVLGTSIYGESTTRGNIRLLLVPSFGKLSGEIAFDGTVHARTVGYNGPATLNFISDSTFTARKPIALGPTGLHVSPATATAPTVLQTTGISTSLPRLRGMIATRIATRRNASSHCEAEAITAEHTAEIIREDFDERIGQSVSRVRKVFALIPKLDAGVDALKPEMRFRSTADYVEMALIRKGTSEEEMQLRPPGVSGDPDVAIRVNRAVLGTAIGDSDVTERFAPLFVKLLETRIVKTAISMGNASPTSTEDPTKWSLDKNWLAVDYSNPKD